MIVELEKEINDVQSKIKYLTERRPPTPLPAVSMTPNLARGSSEMWQIYQYELSLYQQIKDLPNEMDFLDSLSWDKAPVEQVLSKLKERRTLLQQQKDAVLPMLCQPTTRVAPLSKDDKIERAKLIAKHILRSTEPGAEYDPHADIDQIKKLQARLMELEDAYLNSM